MLLQKILPEYSKKLSDLRGTFLTSFCQHFDNFRYSKNILHVIEPLNVLPYGSRILQTLSRHLFDRWSSIGSGYPWWSLCMHEGLFVVEPQMSMFHSLCFCDTCNIRDLIVGISRPSSISLSTLSFTRSVIFHPCDLVTCRNIGWNLTEWAQSIIPSHRRTKPTLDSHASTYSIGKPKRYLFSHPVKVVMVDAIKTSSGSSDLTWSHSLMIRLQYFLLSQYEHRDTIMLDNKVGYVHHGIYTMAWTSFSIRHICHMIQKLIINWPQASIEVY
jgi:hypothetical protein